MNLNLERRLWQKGFKRVVGLDEVGRGPLAGPVVAAAVSIIANCKLKVKNVRSSSSRRDSIIENLRIGVPKEYFIKGMDPEVEKIVKNAIKKYEKLGAKIEEISLPYTEYAIAIYYIIVPSEASANLARYDGIKFGYSVANQRIDTDSLLDVYLQSRKKGFGDEVKRRIMLGTYALSSGYYDAYYLRAQKVRTLIREDFKRAFQIVDFILTPIAPTPAFKIGEKVEDPLLMYLCDVFTAPVNLAGLPAISIPAGKIGKLPVGLQIIGKPFEENKILEIAKTYERI